jgi:crotonobetainyl-CoA:carnitine CoA-transferase CaiB-like acyl-CoA transferase
MSPTGPGGRGVPWLSANLKKSTVHLDTSRAEGIELLARIVAQSDAFLTDRTELWDLRARTVSCRVQTFPDGPDLAYSLPSYDIPIQAQSGAISMTGRIGGPPVPIGFPIADIAPGVYSAIGVLQGLLDGHRRTMTIHALDATVSLLSYLGCSFIAAGEEPGFIGSGHPHIVPYGAFPASDGYIIVAGFTQDFWRNLCHMFDRADLIDNPRYRTFVDRRDNRDELNALLADLFREGTVEEWVARLDVADVPNAPIYSMRAALDQPVVAQRSMITEIDGHPLLHSPIIDVDQQTGPTSRPPLVRDWKASFGRLGVSDAELEQLLAREVIAVPAR